MHIWPRKHADSHLVCLYAWMCVYVHLCVCVHQTMMVKVLFVWLGMGGWTPVCSHTFLLHTHTHTHTHTIRHKDTHMDRLGLFLWEEGVTGQQERPGLLFHWSTPTSYFLDDPAPSGEVIGWEEEASWVGFSGAVVGYPSEACHSNES